MKAMEEYICYLSLGANLGDKIKTVEEALRLLGATDKIQLQGVSSLYETPPWGKTDQPDFVNCAAAVMAELPPLELLHICQSIEKKLGRVRHEHWGARTIDIDLLYIPGVALQERELQLPHPYMLARAFVLVPLAELAPDLVLQDGQTAMAHAMALSDRNTVKKIERKAGE